MKDCDGTGFHFDGTECRGCDECVPIGEDDDFDDEPDDFGEYFDDFDDDYFGEYFDDDEPDGVKLYTKNSTNVQNVTVSPVRSPRQLLWWSLDHPASTDHPAFWTLVGALVGVLVWVALTWLVLR